MDLNADRKIPQWAIIVGFTLLGWLGNQYINSLSAKSVDNQSRVQVQEISITKIEVKIDALIEDLQEIKEDRNENIKRVEAESKLRDEQIRQELLKELSEIKALLN